MLTIRLQRKGKKNQPFFKIVVTEEKKSSTGGRFVEELGFYNPLTKERSLKGDRAKYWMSVGAQPSDTVYNMLVSENVIEGKKRPQQKKSKKQQPAAEAAPAETPQEASASEPAKEEAKTPAEEPGKEERAPAEAPKEEPKKEEETPAPAPEEPKKDTASGS